MSEIMIQAKPAETQLEAVTPMGILQMAISQGADLDKLTKLMDLQERWQATEARKAFVAAMAEFKKSSIRIIKDKDNGQYKSKYVSLGNLVNTVTPYLSEQGLSIRWDIDQSAPPSIRVICIVTHAMGHSESVAMACPPDKSGAKNPIQEIKSAITYAKAATFESICGLASTDANLDDDGNGSSDDQLKAAAGRNERAAGTVAPEVTTPLPITNEQLGRVKDALQVNKKKASAMYEFLGLKVGSPIPASRLQEALVWIGVPVPTEMPQAVADAFTILEWDEYERNTYIEKHESRWDEIQKSLNNMIDAENEK